MEEGEGESMFLILLYKVNWLYVSCNSATIVGGGKHSARHHPPQPPKCPSPQGSNATPRAHCSGDWPSQYYQIRK